MFTDIEWVCCSGDTSGLTCVCTTNEMVARRLADGVPTRALTAEEREYFIGEAEWAGEGFYSRPELEKLADRDLASAVLRAWHMYVLSHSDY